MTPRVLRVATAADAGAIIALMTVSIRGIFPAFYDAEQTASGARYIPEVDNSLTGDDRYYVIEEDGELIASGGWVRRHVFHPRDGNPARAERLLDPATEPATVKAMFVRPDRTRQGLGTQLLDTCIAGARDEHFAMMTLVATLPGAPLYRRYGFVTTDEKLVRLPDGVTIACELMELPL